MSFLFNRKKKTSSSSSFSSSSSTTNSTTPQPPIVSNATTTKTVEQLQQEEENKFLDAAKYGNLDKIKEYINNGGNKEAKDNYGWTALHWASRNGHLNIIKYLIETCHVDKEAKTNDGWNALHYASYNGYLDIVKYLIESCQVDTEVKNYYGQTACDLAKKSNNNNVVKYLEKARVHSTTTHVNNAESGNASAATNYDFALVTDQKKSSTTSTNTNSTTPQIPIVSNTTNTKTYEQLQQEEKEFLDAAENGNLNIVKGYINNGGNKKTESNNGRTALHCASYNGHLDIVKYLIETCQVNKEAKTNSGETALHIAIEFGRLEIVQYLIETYQVDTEAKNNNGWTALHFASRYGHLYVVKYLIETCQVDTEAKNNNGWTALHFASRYGHLYVVKYLIESCQVDTEAKDNNGWNALHNASYIGHLNVVKYLIETCQVNKEAKDNNGWNALHWASYNGNLYVVKYLIESCQVDTEVKNKYGKTAYELAKDNNKNNVVKYLEKARVHSTTTNVNNAESGNASTTNNDGLQLSLNTTNAPKQKALDSEQKVLVPVIEFIEAARKGNLDKVQECINNGIDMEATINNGITVLHTACSSGHLDIVRYLVQECSINVEMKTNIGRTALHEVCSDNHRLDIVKYLIQTGRADTEARDNDGWAALHFACRYGCLDIVEFLVDQCHVNLDLENNAGEVAYDVARKDEIKEYLSQARANKQAITNELEKQQHSASVEIAKQEAAVKEQSPTSDHREVSIVHHDSDAEWDSELMLSLQSEMQSFVDKLSQLGDSHHYIDERRDVLDLLCVEKCNTVEEQKEQSAILASPLHRDFYILLQRKLKCMIKSCETLSTGMVGAGGGDFRSFAARTIREKGCNVLRETKLGIFIGNAVQWSKKNLAVVPFIDTVGSVFQLIVTLKDEHDRYLGLARVADFATMVCLHQYGTTSLDSAVEKLARWIVRARCASPSCKFVEETDEFGKFKLLMIKLLADSGNTPAKEQASKAADCAFAHIMKPEKGSILLDVLHGDTFDVKLDEALAASVLGISLEDLRELDSFSATSQGAIPSSVDTNNGPRVFTANTPKIGLSGTSFHTDSFASSDVVAEQEEKIQQQNEMIQKQDEMIQKLSYQMAHLEKKIKNSNSQTNYDAGDGLMYANPAEQFKNEIASLQTDNVILDQRLRDQAAIIDNLMSRIADQEKQLSRLPYVSVNDTKGGKKNETNRNRST